jgi:hypothetical protein
VPVIYEDTRKYVDVIRILTTRAINSGSVVYSEYNLQFQNHNKIESKAKKHQTPPLLYTPYPSAAALVTSSVLASSGMVQTRSGHAVFYSEASYGRAARKETTRQRRKRKLTEHTLVRGCGGDDSNTSTSQTTPRKTQAQIRQDKELSTPPSTLNRVGRPPPSKTERLL